MGLFHPRLSLSFSFILGWAASPDLSPGGIPAMGAAHPPFVDIAQLVERQLPKLDVAGSRPVIGSKYALRSFTFLM